MARCTNNMKALFSVASKFFIIINILFNSTLQYDTLPHMPYDLLTLITTIDQVTYGLLHTSRKVFTILVAFLLYYSHLLFSLIILKYCYYYHYLKKIKKINCYLTNYISLTCLRFVGKERK